MTIEMYEDVMNHLQIDKYRELIIEQDHKITELEKACEETQKLLDKQIEATYKLDKENAELKEKLLEQKQYTEFKCNEAVKKKEVYERKHYLLTKASEIIKKYLTIGVGGKITQNYLDVTKEAEQFIKYSEVDK